MEVLENFWTSVGYAVAQGSQTPLNQSLNFHRHLDFIFVNFTAVHPKSKFKNAIIRSILLEWHRINRMCELKPALVSTTKQPRTCKCVVKPRIPLLIMLVFLSL